MDYRAFNADVLPADFLQLALHCDALCDGRPLPSQYDFRLHDVPWLFGRLYLIDVIDRGKDYQFKAFGIFWQAIYGADLTGMRLSEIEATYDNLNALRGQFDSIIARKLPVLSVGKLVWPGQKSITYDRFLVPFTADGANVSRIIVAAHYDDNTDDMVFYRGEGLPRLVLEEPQLPYLAIAS